MNEKVCKLSYCSLDGCWIYCDKVSDNFINHLQDALKEVHLGRFKMTIYEHLKNFLKKNNSVTIHIKNL